MFSESFARCDPGIPRALKSWHRELSSGYHTGEDENLASTQSLADHVGVESSIYPKKNIVRGSLQIQSPTVH